MLERLAGGRHHDPHALLGPHALGATTRLLAYLPAVQTVQLEDGRALQRLGDTDFFWLDSPSGTLPVHPGFVWHRADGRVERRIDPYSFAPSVAASDLQLFGSGGHAEAWKLLGAHAACFDGIYGVRFAVWAPNACRVSVVGPFCDWDGRRLPMRVLGQSGIWELFVPGLAAGELYKFELRNRDSGEVLLKTDPYARAM